MAKLLYIQASPRGERSASIRVGDAFVEAYRHARGDDEIATVSLFERDLPPFDGAALEAKYQLLGGGQPSADQRRAWGAVEQVIEEFASADRYLLAVPMWNFGIPYRLKHYVDLLVQPGYTFGFSPEAGYSGLLTGKRAVAIYARGGDYSAAEAAALDMQRPYVEAVLGFLGIEDRQAIVVEPTMAGGPDVADGKVAEAIARARELAASF